MYVNYTITERKLVYKLQPMKRGIRFIITALILIATKSSANAQAVPDTFRISWGICSGALLDLKLNDLIVGPYRVTKISGITDGDRLELDSVNGLLNYCYTGIYIPQRRLFYHTDRSTDSTLIVFNMDISADSVLPGDFNRDRVVNALDVLSLGLAYSEVGPYRDRSSLVFVPQAAPDWLDSLQFLRRTLNSKHVDGDGNGIIDASDISLVNVNYGKSYGAPFETEYLPGFPVLLSVADTLGSGTADTLELVLRTTSTITNLYGLRFRFHYDKRLVRSASLTGRYDIESALLEDMSGILRFMEIQADSGFTDYCIAKTGKIGSSGSGELARLIIVIDDNIDGSTMGPGSYLFDLFIDQIIGIADNGDAVYFNQNALISYSYFISGLKNEVSENIKVYPNPASHEIFAEWASIGDVRNVYITDMYGSKKEVPLTVENTYCKLDVSSLSPGMYLFSLETAHDVLTKKIFVHP